MILLIDDDAAVLEAISTLLEMFGYDVVTAGSGREGIRLAQDRLPDLVLSNFNMPDVDGLDVLVALRRSPSTGHILFVFISSESPDSIREKCVEVQADAVVHKNDAAEGLLETVENLLPRKSASGGTNTDIQSSDMEPNDGHHPGNSQAGTRHGAVPMDVPPDIHEGGTRTD